ncbi:MAG: flagellar motor protein [Planctomycetota bacterium]
MVASWLGLAVAIGFILLGQVLEGGHVSQLLQPTAAFIVFGGTLGATILSTPPATLIGAVKSLGLVFFDKGRDLTPLLQQLVALANSARRDGLLSLEGSISEIKHPFFSRFVVHIIDGYDAQLLQEMMEERIAREEESRLSVAKVWETMGGFSPTVGILGAVLGLIHVMSNLSDSSKLGAGIAVAFVATVYGVGFANLVVLPIANKLKHLAKRDIEEMQVIATGLICIQNGLSHRIVENRLTNLLGEHSKRTDRESLKMEKQVA